MDMFAHYYQEEDLISEEDLTKQEEEREIIWAVHDFADQCQKHTFLTLMQLLVDELKKRGYSA